MQSRNSFLQSQREAIANQEFDLSLLNITKFTNIFQLGDSIIAFAIRLIALFAVLSLILGGFWIMTAFGDEGRVDTGKKIILYGVIGLAIVLASYVIEYDFLKVLYSLGR